MSTPFDFSRWPPSLSDDQLATLTHHATTYALAHGLTYLPPAPSQPPSPSSVIHAPVSLIPTPLPRSLFEKAQRLQSVYNTLYARVATDQEFLDNEMGAELGAGRADEFVRKLWLGWKQIREEGLAQPLHLGLFRSDYLLHTGDGENSLGLKQVEFNTISSSFGPLSERAAAMHRYLHALTDYYHISPHLKQENFPPNDTTSGLAQGLAEAHKAYGVPSSYILFVVQPNERNVFDQRWLEYELLEKHHIRVLRQTLAELSTSATLSGPSRTLHIRPANAASPTPIEISTVYFRAGYVPTDYPTDLHYDARFTLERSAAIKCPSIQLQLAGGKKVQEALSQPGVVERFFSTSSEATALRETWMHMWALDASDTPLFLSNPDLNPLSVGAGAETKEKEGEPAGTTLARALAPTLVLKPQREGGGNNVYKDDIPAFLDTLPSEERKAWIAMSLIVPPKGVGSYLVRAASGQGANEGVDGGGRGRGNVVRAETISELGIFGWALFGTGADEGDSEGETGGGGGETGGGGGETGGGGGETRTRIVRERGDVGWLMRTKGVESNEGGVAAGFSVLDSVVLVDG